MLRRLKEQVSQVANELDGRLTNNRASIASQGSQSQAHATNISQNDQDIEGFLCPMCMVELGGPDELTIHFEKEHSNTSSSQSTDQNSFPASTLATYTKEQEVEELRTRINEEKLFADKIKEELDNIKAVIAKASDVTEDEVPYMAQQIQVLTADKGMLTRQFLELEKESRQQSREMQQIKQERGDLMVKLKQMSIRMRELTDETEATKIEMEDIRRELKVATSDITRYELEVARLEKMLDQRPSEDDVNVLRTELVNAQKLMDNIAQEKDIEIKEHLNSIRNLSMEREKQHALNENLQKRIAESEETTKQLQTTLEAQADELKQRDERIIQLEDRIQGNIFELAENKNNVSRLEGKTVDAQAALEKLSSINESNEEQMIILKTKFEQSTNECKRLEAVFDEKVTVQGERLKTVEMANLDLTNELASMGSLLDKERALIEEKNKEISIRDSCISEMKEKLAESEKNSSKFHKELEENAGIVETLTTQLNKLQENSKDLMEKISTGEGGAKVAIEQLEQEKVKLTYELQCLAEKNKKTSAEFENKIAVLEKQIREAEATRTDIEHKWKQENEKLNRKVVEVEDEAKRRGENFVEMEKEIEEERQKYNDRTMKLKDALVECEQKLEMVKKESEDRKRVVGEKDSHLEESRKRIEDAVQKLEDAEKRARELEASVSNQESEMFTKERELAELRNKLSDSDSFIEELKVQVEKVSNELSEKQLEVDNMIAEIKEKEAHWKTKREEFEAQIVRNQEENEEASASLKFLQQQLTKEKETSAEDKNQLRALNSQLEESKAGLDKLTCLTEEKTEKVNKLESTISDLCQERNELSAISESLRTENENLISKIQALEKSHQQSEEENSIAIQHIIDEKAKLEKDIETKDSTIQATRESVEAKENEIENLKTNQRVIEEELVSKISLIESFNSRIEEFEKEMASGKREIEKLEAEKNEDIEKRRLAIESQNVKQQEVEKLQMELDEKQLVIERMTSSKSQFEAMFADVQQTLQKEVADKTMEIERQMEQIDNLGSATQEKIESLESRLRERERVVESLKAEMAEMKLAEQEKFDAHNKLKEDYEDVLVMKVTSSTKKRGLRKTKDDSMKLYPLCTSWAELISRFRSTLTGIAHVNGWTIQKHSSWY
ncbi:unnamed protein product [Caenorhabditis brenneri]